MSDETTPTPVLSYATPAALDRRGVWREGNLLVKPPGRAFPMRCVVCNNPEVQTKRVTFRYMPFFKLVTKSVYRNIAVPMCHAHQARARRQWWAGLGLRAAGVVTLIGGAVLLAENFISPPAMGGVTVLVLVMMWRGDRLSQKYVSLELVNVARGHLYFSGAGRAYLDSVQVAGDANR